MGHKEELIFAGCLHHETQIGAFNEGLRDDSLVLKPFHRKTLKL